MENEVDPNVIKTTQTSLGKYVKRPPLTEKLLKKPPFRFLHDIVTTILKTTGFFEGLFEEEELVSDNVKDRDSKILFLNKVIFVIGFTTGKSLAVKPSKIVAGQEPEKTNELLQCLAQALDKKISSEEAVKRYKENEKVPQAKDKNIRESVKPVKKVNDVKKLTSKSSEKLTSQKKSLSNERTSVRNEKDKIIGNKQKQKDSGTLKKETLPKKTTKQSKAVTEKVSVQKNEDVQKGKNINIVTDKKEEYKVNDEQLFSSINDRKSESLQVHEELDSRDASKTIPILNENEKENLNTSYTIADTDIDSTSSSHDLRATENEKEEIQLTEENDDKTQDKHNQEFVEQKTDSIVNNMSEGNLKSNNDNTLENDTSENIVKENNQNNSTISKPLNKIENDHNSKVIRPLSVRPSSSRPGAPRPREKYDNIIINSENLLVGKVNIIEENTPNEEEEDTSILIVEQTLESELQKQPNHLESSTQHGHLVQQILESQKEFSQTIGKTEIEWQLGAQKEKETLNKEIEQLRFNIQALSRVANPLGKLLDHIQEDVELMRQELQQWTKVFEDASKELSKQKAANEDSLYPLYTKLKNLDSSIEEKYDKINDLKIAIHRNSSRIEKLLVSGNVQ